MITYDIDNSIKLCPTNLDRVVMRVRPLGPEETGLVITDPDASCMTARGCQ
jgi:hypothetical protein